MATTISRTAYDLLVDDDGSGTTGSIWDKQDVDDILDAIDALIAANIEFGGSVTTNGQIIFPAVHNAAAGANTLDDYEEGIWTPVIGGDGGTSGQTYAQAEGTYIKVGRLVVARFTTILTAKGTITGNAIVSGLPFTVTAVSNEGSGLLRFQNLATNWSSFYTNPFGGATYALLAGVVGTQGTDFSLVAAADIADDSDIRGTITYFASA